MPYYPTEHDWTLTVRPDRIPLDERFPGKYAVNSIPTNGNRNGQRSPKPWAKEHRRGQTGKSNRENPNHIPLSRRREVGELPPEDATGWDGPADIPEENLYIDDSTPDRIKG
jgi:hypothetical protein